MAVAVRPPARVRAPRPRPRLEAVDLLLLGYLAVVTAVAVHRAPAQPECWWVAGANLLAAALVGLFTRPISRAMCAPVKTSG